VRDIGTDDTDVVGDDFVWLTYSELAKARATSTSSAIRLAFRRKWRRQDGNDGTIKVAVPAEDTKPQNETADSDSDSVGRDIGQVVGLLETAAVMLRERGEAADGMVAALHANAEEELEQARAETATEREARRRAEVGMKDAEARLAQLREAFEAARHEAEAQRMAEQTIKEKAVAEAAQLRQTIQSRRELGLLARLRVAWRRE
jgi:hypothetical protein